MAGRTRSTRPISLALRVTGALALLAMGALHLQQYLDAGYSALPTIGTLFLLNFVGGVALGVALLLPVGRLPRLGASAPGLLAVTGAAMARRRCSGSSRRAPAPRSPSRWSPRLSRRSR